MPPFLLSTTLSVPKYALPRSYSPCTPHKNLWIVGQPLFTAAKTWKQPKCSPAEEWTKKNAAHACHRTALNHTKCILMSQEPLFTLHSPPRGPQAFLLVIQGVSTVLKIHSQALTPDLVSNPGSSTSLTLLSKAGDFSEAVSSSATWAR